MTCTRTTSTLASGFTQAQLLSAIETAFTSAGFSSTVYDSFTSGTDLCIVYAVVVNSSKTYGTTYVRVRVTTGFAIYQECFTAWNTSTHTGGGTNTYTEVNCGTLVNTASVAFNSFTNGQEIQLVIISQSTTVVILGTITPSVLRGSWDLNSYTATFIPGSNALTTIVGTTFNQFSPLQPNTSVSNTFALAGSGYLASANIVDGQRDIVTAPVVANNAGGGVLGQMSSDFSIVASSGSNRYDIIAPTGTSQQYTIVVTSSNGGIALRTT